MLAVYLLALLLQKPDSTHGKDVDVEMRVTGALPADRAVTPQHLATAYANARTRELVQRARAARIAQDSAITRYAAMSYQRVSVYMRAGVFARDRLVFRGDRAARVEWERGVGARIQLVGSRDATPFDEPGADSDDDEVPIPYYPGREPLVLGGGVVQADQDKESMIHPLAERAEAYYTFAAGDSLTIHLGERRPVRVIELQFRPRDIAWNVGVGSVWLDADTYQVVRAAYRLAVPIAFSNSVSGSGAGLIFAKTLLNPLRGEVSAITAEYGLHDGMFWLPSLERVEGSAQASFLRIRFDLRQSYRYESVNGTIPIARFEAPPDTASTDTTRAGRERRRAERRAESAARDSICENGGTHVTYAKRRYKGQLPIFVTVPCADSTLIASTELPPVFDDAEDRFSSAARDELVDALKINVPFVPQPPHLRFGLGEGLVRYNRVEGLSAALIAEQELGVGLTLQLVPRIGLSDRVFNAELTLQRARGTRSTQYRAYRRLNAANDWGSPLGLGASLSTLLFGRDEGFYFRSTGAEIVHTHTGRTPLTLRVFGERQGDAPAHDPFSIAHTFGDGTFAPNIRADEGRIAGVGARITHTFGYNVERPRLLADGRIEAAGGDFDFARGAVALTLSSPIGRKLAAAITAGAGSTAGTAPLQRLFYLGGPGSVRGVDAGAARGDSYWLGSIELGGGNGGLRPVVFYDVGWAGSRDTWTFTPDLSGAGIGLSILDGMLRIDVAKGMKPSQGIRTNLYLEARW